MRINLRRLPFTPLLKGQIGLVIIAISIMLIGLSCDTTKPDNPVINYFLTLNHSAALDTTYADFGVTTVTITAELTDDNDKPVVGESIQFTWSTGLVTYIDTETDANGRMRVRFEDAGYSSECLDADNIEDCTSWDLITITGTFEDQFGNTAEADDFLIVLPLATKAETITLLSTASSNDNRVLLDDNAPDSMYTVVFNAWVNDDNDLRIENIEVNFEFDPNYSIVGALSSNKAVTDSYGHASISLFATGMELLNAVNLDSIKMDAYISLDELSRVVEESNGLYSMNVEELARSGNEINASVFLQFLTEGDWYSSLVENMYVNVNPPTIIFDSNFPDSTFSSAININVRDAAGIGIPNVPITLANQPVNGNIIGSISPSNLLTDADGFATSSFLISYSEYINDDSPSIIVSAGGEDDTITVLLQTDAGVIFEDIGHFDTWVLFSEILINNSNVSISDTIFARVTNTNGGALQNIPVNFSKNSPIGFLTQTVALTDENGLARSVFNANPSEIPPDSLLTIDFNIYVNDVHNDTIPIEVFSQGDVNVVYDVAGFAFYPDVNNVMHTLFNQTNISVMVNNNSGVGISSVPVYFRIDNESGLAEGILSTALSYSCCGVYSDTTDTNENGVASVTYTNISGGSENIIAEIIDPSTQDILLADTILVSTLGTGDINVWVDYAEYDINNSNIGITDSIYARVTNILGSPMQNVPVTFSKPTDLPGYLSESVTHTDSTGLAISVYNVTPGEINDDSTYTNTIPININVNDAQEETIEIVINVEGNINPEYIVDDFHFTHPSDTLNILDAGDLRVVTKDENGVGVSDVAIRFEINNGDGIGAHGILGSPLVYTSGPADTSGANPGFATVNYEVLDNGIDLVHAYIIDPALGSTLLRDSLYVSAVSVQDTVVNLNSYASSNVISVSNMDSTYVDTLFAIAQNSSGGGIAGVVINFSLIPEDLNYGFIYPSSNIVTDSIGVAKAYFESAPGIVSGIDERDITFIISTQAQDNTQTDSLTITFDNSIPVCPECVAEFQIWPDSSIYVLPTESGEVTLNIFAGYVDSLGYGPEPNSIVTFESVHDSAGTLVPFASIEEVGFFDIDYPVSDLPQGFFDNYTEETILVAQTTFYKQTASGLATVIATYGSYKDTINIQLNSTDASYIEFIPAVPNEIMVIGGGGIESTDVTAVVRDGNGYPVTEPYNVVFQITSPSPLGVHLNGVDDLLISDPIETSNGSGTITVNAGNFPGTVRMRAELYAIDDPTTMLSFAEDVPITIMTGPPAYGEINFATQEIQTIGGGNYELPLSVTLWDLHSNPVKDSTNVWLSLYDCAPPFSEDSAYYAGDIIMWGTESITDSLVYICTADTLLPPSPPPFFVDPDTNWVLKQQPAFISATDVVTGNENPWGGGDAGNAFSGIAWSSLYYTSNPIFTTTIIKAQTYDGFGNYLIIDSRSNHNGQCTMLPFQPGSVFINLSPAFHDFSVGPNLEYSTTECGSNFITVSATLVDFYGENIDSGALQLTAIGGTLVEQDDVIPIVGDETWESNWVQITDPNGAARWYIHYPIQLCPPTNPENCTDECELCEYDDFTSQVWVDLILPVQTQSNQLEVTLIRSGGECEDCP